MKTFRTPLSSDGMPRDASVAKYLVLSIVGVTIFSILHFIAAFIAFSISFDLGMERFDSGGDPSFIEKASGVVVAILWFPGLIVADALNIHNNLAEWFLVISNSIVWGIASFSVFIAILHVRGVRISKLRWRFSLLSLLVVTTTVAILLGFLALLVRAL